MKSKSEKFILALIGGMLIVFVLLVASGVGMLVYVSRNAPPAKSRPNESVVLNQITIGITAKRITPVYVADVVISNSSPYMVKDVTIKCTFSGESGTDIQSTKETFYVSIDPRSQYTANEHNFGFVHSQAAGVECAAFSLKIVE